jgi:Flp pilus assembly protein TadG
MMGAFIVRRLRRDERGVAAIEFAILLPFLILLCFGGYAVAEAVSIGRKVTITARAVADLTSQYASMSDSDMSNVLGASAQIIAPYSFAPLTIRLSEVSTDPTGQKATVTWSTGANKYSKGDPITLPPAMNVPNQNYIYSEVGYSFQPSYFSAFGPFAIGDSIYMLPRLSPNITYTGS